MIKNNAPYIPVEGDSLRFAMKKRYSDPDEEVILMKDIPVETRILEI